MESPMTVKPHAVTIRVNDLCRWFEMVICMEKASRQKLIYNGEVMLGPKWIYRGQANSKWEINSSFERAVLSKVRTAQDDKTEENLRQRERASILHYRQWTDVSDQEMPILNGEWLALMQHHGVPTRLVDFSEVPLMALAFSLEDKMQEESDFAIWAVRGRSSANENIQLCRKLRPGLHSVELLDSLSFRAYCDEWDRREMNRILSVDSLPEKARLLQYVPIRMSKRQKLQRGLFLASTHLSKNFMPLLHEWTRTEAKDLNDTELEMYVADAFSSEGFVADVANAHIIKYVFDRRLRDKARTFLSCCNITDLTRYGGIEKLSEETKEILVDGFHS